jgi:hypothetical protein
VRGSKSENPKKKKDEGMRGQMEKKWEMERECGREGESKKIN